MFLRNLIITMFLGVLSDLLASCGMITGAVSVVDVPQTPTSVLVIEATQGFAIVESNEINLLESLPSEVVVISRGLLPDSCTYIQETQQAREGQSISIFIITNRPSNIDCIQQAQPFELYTKLNTGNLDPGKYNIVVNGVVGEFEIPKENATHTPFATLAGIVWHDLCSVAGGEDDTPLYPSVGCISVENSYRANGFMETGEPGLGGVSVRLGLGNCPANGYVTTTTSQDGAYTFEDLVSGTYCVSIEPLDPQNTNILAPGQWSSPAQSIGQSVASVSVSLNPGENKHGVDFGWDFQFLPVPQQFPKPTATPNAITTFCDRVKFVADLTVPDYTPYTPGTSFTKSWRIQNDGTCTWTTDYDLVFVSGEAMTNKLSYALSKNVGPGETIDITIDMIAPRNGGNYKSNWMLMNSSGKSFGLGKGADQAFWALIKVVVPQNNYAYDFAANYCQASWSSENGILSCPGSTSSTRGFVTFFDRPTLENRNEDEPALWLRPNHNEEGWISGKYPPIPIKDGDHFRAWVGCLAESKGCDVTFTLSYSQGGQMNTLGQWHEIFDGEVTAIDLDLSFLAQKSVEFTLSTDVNNKKFETANAFWFVPRLENDDTDVNLTEEMAVNAAKRIVAAGIGISPEDLKVVQVVGPLTWHDSCLEVDLEDVSDICIDIDIPGYQVILKHAGTIYEAHTNMDGSIVYWFY